MFTINAVKLLKLFIAKIVKHYSVLNKVITDYNNFSILKY